MGFYKKIAYFFLGALLLSPLTAFAIPSSVDRIIDHIQPLIQTDYIKGLFFTATSTTQASTFPYASTTVTSANTLCLSSDCRTVWPGGSTFGTSSLSALAPIQYTQNSSLAQFSITQAGLAGNGYLSSTDFNTFNNKISSTSLSVTTTGTSGAATYTPSTGVFNIPQYSGGDNWLFNGPTAISPSTTVGIIVAASSTFTGVLNAGGLNVQSSTIPANGMYLQNTNLLAFATNSTQRWSISSGGILQANSSSGAGLNISAASSINPTFTPNRSDATTGIGAQASGNISLITGGVEQERISTPAASVANVLWPNSFFSGGTATTQFPALFVQPTGTAAVTTWNTGGTVLGVNAPSGFAGNFLDFHVAGAAGAFTVSANGTLANTGNITANGIINGVNSVTSGGNIAAAANAVIGLFGRGVFSSTAAGIMQLGNPDAAAPVAQTFRVQSVVAGTANTAGQNWIQDGSLSTGSGTSGDIIFQTGSTGAASTVQNTPVTALTIKGATQNVGIASTSPYFKLSVGTNNVGTFGISTTTAGCAQFSAFGELYSTGTNCGTGGGGVTSVTGTYPIISSGGTTPVISTAFSSSTLTASSPLTGSFAQVGTGGSLGIQVANTSQSGYLTNTDWNTFNGKQAAGNYITALTGDGTASGPGSSAFTLATVNSNVGSFTNANVTVNAKGLITAVSNGSAGGSTFGQAFEVDSSNWLSATTTNTYGINANAQGKTFGYGIGDSLLGYASSTNLSTIFGLGAGGQNATTSATVASTTAIGFNAGKRLSTGINNTFVGAGAGGQVLTNNANTAIGSGALSSLANNVTSFGNTVIGYNAGSNLNGIFTGSNIIIGADVLAQVGTSAGQLNIGNSIFGTGMYGDQSTPSNTPQTSAKIGIATSSSGTLLSTLVIGGNQTIGADYQVAAPTNGLLVEGNVGIGTTTPGSIFSIGGSAISSMVANFGNLLSTVFSPFTVATTSPNAFAVKDQYGTAALNVNTASTTGNIFTIQATSTTDTLFSVDQYGHLTASSTPSKPTISCAPSGGTISAGSNDVTGDFTTGTLSTACTLTFGRAYSTTPEVMVGGGLTSGLTRSTTAVTFTLSAAVTGDTISYFVIMP